jgi:predicted RNase H-like nuclease (RuvC/YqgF family)
MSENTIVTIISFLLGGGTIGALISFWANRKKTDAETDNLVIEGATALLKPLTDRVTCLETDLERERKLRRELNDELETVRADTVKRSKDNLKRITDLEDSLLAKDKEIANLQSESETLKLQVAKQKEQISALEQQLETLKETPVTKKTGPLKGSS